MCGVVGYCSEQTIDINKFLNILKNSMIRGKHATGVAWNNNGTIKTKIISSQKATLDLNWALD